MRLGNIFCISKVEKDWRVSRNRWGEQQIKENDGFFVFTKGTFKFQRLELGFERFSDDAKEVLPTHKDMRKVLKGWKWQKFLRVISKTQEKDFENECQEEIGAQKLITQFWGYYKPSPLERISSSRFLGLQHKEKIATPGKNLWVKFNPLVKLKRVGAPIIGTPRKRYGKTWVYPQLGALEIKLSKNC